MGFSRQEYWSELPFPPPGDLPHPGMEILYSYSKLPVVCSIAPSQYIIMRLSAWLICFLFAQPRIGNFHEESALSLGWHPGSPLDNNKEILNFHSQLRSWKMLPGMLQNSRWHLEALRISIILEMLLQHQLSYLRRNLILKILNLCRYMSSSRLQTCIFSKKQGLCRHTSVSEGQRPWPWVFPQCTSRLPNPGKVKAHVLDSPGQCVSLASWVPLHITCLQCHMCSTWQATGADCFKFRVTFGECNLSQSIRDHASGWKVIRN